MTPEQRRQLCKDIDTSHQRHRDLIDRIAAGEKEGLAKEWDELDRLNEEILRKTKAYMVSSAGQTAGVPFQSDEQRREEQGNRGPDDIPGFGQGA